MNLQEPKTIALIVYSVTLILIFLFPPTEIVYSYNRIPDFQGWDFIFNLEGTYKINITYLLIEIGIATLIYIFFLYFITNFCNFFGCFI